MSTYYSNFTKEKQDVFRSIIEHHVNVCFKIYNKQNRVNQVYNYFDLFAGPGVINDNSDIGSPLIFDEVSKSFDSIFFQSRYFDIDEQNIKSLQRKVKGDFFVGDSSVTINKIPGNNNLGLAYLDPFGKDYYKTSYIIVKELCDKFPKVDILIRVAMTALKRVRGAGYTNFNIQNIVNDSSKKHWIIKELSGNWQWTFLIGTNYLSWADWKKAGFYNIESNTGKEIFQVACYTDNEMPENKIIKKKWKIKQYQQMEMF